MLCPKRASLDLLTAPLSNCSIVVEASAGTGKTYALAALYLRLLVEAGLDVENILVVTFTEAATAELKTRIRLRIVEALEALATEKPTTQDRFLTDLLGRTDPAIVAERLRKAARNLDLACIFTIHGFCQRMLTDFAFECGGPFQSDLVTDESSYEAQVIVDYFRRTIQDCDELSAKVALNQGLLGTLGKVATILKNHPLLDIAEEDHSAPDLGEAYSTAAPLYQDSAALWKKRSKKVIQVLTNQEALNGNSYRVSSMESWFEALDDYFSAEKLPITSPPEKLDKFGTRSLVKATKKNHETPADPFFPVCDALVEALSRLEDAKQAFFARLNARFARLFPEQLRCIKEERNQLGFSDLLTQLHSRLCSANGQLPAKRIRDRFQATLIDEFQDTDILQFEIFSNLFTPGAHALYCIGDPKQAIYSFRGADIHAYLSATAASSILTQTTNYRSSTGMVESVGKLFSRCKAPFVHQGIPFEKSDAFDIQKRLRISGDHDACLRIWHLKSEDFGLPPGEAVTRVSRVPVAKAVAGEIARLLNLSAKGEATFQSQTDFAPRPLKASDFAVLVKGHKEADLIRDALAERQIPCVRQQTQDVLDSQEASELRLILGAMARFTNEGILRAALATDILGWSALDLDGLEDDEPLRDGLLESFTSYKEQWESEGIMSALTSLMAEREVQARLLSFPDGERKLTNLMHCLEILHAKETESALAVDGLLAWFVSAARGNERDEESKLRLETDAPAVRILTIHASKGLEFNIVFCPYVGWSPLFFPPEPYHDPEKNNRLALDLDKRRRDHWKPLYLGESAAELIRLFYVAVTRAKSRCYLAWGAHHQAHDAPMARLLDIDKASYGAPAIQSALDGLAKDCQHIAVSPLPDPGRGMVSSEKPDYSDCRALEFTRSFDSSWGSSSFTSLAGSRKPGPFLRENDEEAPNDTASTTADDGAKDLPSGVVAGNMFHEFFQTIDFQSSGTEVFENNAARLLPGYGLDVGLAPRIALLARRTLDAELHGGVRLADVSPSHRRAEADFHVPLVQIQPQKVHAVYKTWSHSFPHPWQEELSGWRTPPRSGFLTGSMDLFFQHAGRYYLLDWKSNRLGPGIDSYRPEKLRAAMSDHWYFLQYHLYCLALERHLATTLPDYDYDAHFGGVYYLFIKGIDPDVPGSGVFFDKPARGFLTDLGQAILSTPSEEAMRASF